MWQLKLGNCKDLIKDLEDNSIDSIVTDPPYELGFMEKKWGNSGIAYDVELWTECLRVLKPGGHLIAFSGSRTYHRMAVAIEDAGFDIRDQIMWVYGSGFPKGHNISKGIDKAAGAEREVVKEDLRIRNSDSWESTGGMLKAGVQDFSITAPATPAAKQWDGWGTALKPAHEPICVARKPLIGTVAENVLQFGTGGINIDGCRVGSEDTWQRLRGSSIGLDGNFLKGRKEIPLFSHTLGRWPANFIHDGSAEVLAGFPASDRSSAARFFYCAKASKRDRGEGLEGFPQIKGGSMNGAETREGKPTNHPIRANHHPTVKPTDLMRYLCRLFTPPNGIILDPFTGSGSTGKAAILEGFHFVGFDMQSEYIDIATARIKDAEKKINSKLF